MGRIRDLSGQTFNRLTAVTFVGLNKYRKSLWSCKCECGNEVVVLSANLVNGNTKSCGCYNMEKIIERNTTHGMKGTRIYRIWKAMRHRCYNPNSNIYKYYGGKGVFICKEWFENFATFNEWAQKNGYQDNLTIDRIDSNGNYEPSNCRWITIQEQQRNKTRYQTDIGA